MKLPKKISPCPIINSTVEIRFNSLLPSEAVFGVLYEKFKDEYKRYEKLPILQIPEEVRSSDPNLIYQAHYRLFKDKYLIQIGPKMISFSCVDDYDGWDIFFKEAKSVFLKSKKASIFNRIDRLGLRYINLFPGSALEKVKLEIKMNDKILDGQRTAFRTILKSDPFICNLQLADNVDLQYEGKLKSGSVLDIDVSIEGESIFENLNELIDSAHKTEKKLFYNLLKENFLETLKPEY